MRFRVLLLPVALACLTAASTLQYSPLIRPAPEPDLTPPAAQRNGLSYAMSRLTFLTDVKTAKSDERLGTGSRCSIAPTPSVRARSTTVLLASATADTVLAGPGEVSASARGGHSGTGAPGPVYGQVVEVRRFGGADSARLARAFGEMQNARALVVPWDYDPACAPARWTRSFAWVETGVPGAFGVRLRADSLWVDGWPVFDVFMAVLEPYPAAFRSGRRALDGSDEMPWLTPEQYLDLLLTTPPYEDWKERPDSSWAVVQSWLSANPDLARRYPAAVIAEQIAGSVAGLKARRVLVSIKPPITGTYEMALFLNDGPGRTFYIRTRAHPSSEWRHYNAPWVELGPLDQPARPTAYNMIASAAGSLDALPADCVDARDIRSEGYVYVIDPPAAGNFHTAWRGWLEVRLVTVPFRNDPALERFRLKAFEERSARWRPGTALEAPARFWYDGGVLRVEQTIRLQDGRTLTVRGERVSDAVIACDG